LRHASELSSNTLNAYSDKEKRRIFAHFGTVAQIACDFYKASKEHLDQVALNGKIGQDLENATQEIAEALDKLKLEYTELNLYLLENSKIVDNLKEYGISRIDNFSDEMDNLKKHIQNELARFDNIIKGIIEELEKEKEDIGRRNKTLI